MAKDRSIGQHRQRAEGRWGRTDVMKRLVCAKLLTLFNMFLFTVIL